MSLSSLFLLFLIYSVIGWICEVVYCSVIERKFVNRGFLMGPLCPIYGVGGLLVIFLLEPFKENLYYLFVMAVVVTTLLEYVTSWALESIFATKWWDYSQFRLNIRGRVCLLNSLLFGAMSVIAVHFVHPAILNMLFMVPAESRILLARVLFAVLAVDFTLTLRTLVDFEARLSLLKEFTESVKESLDPREWFNELDLRGSLERIREKALRDPTGPSRCMAERLEDLMIRSRGMRRLLLAFPGMKSLRHGHQLDLFRTLHRIGRRYLLQSGSVPETRCEKSSVPGSAASTGTDSPSVTDLVWVFAAASFAGVILETLWSVFAEGQVQSRTGLVWGGLNPLYGTAALILALSLSKIPKKNALSLFFASFCLVAAFQYLCSLGQELALGTVSWDYSRSQFNLHGRISLLVCLLFGLLGQVWVRDLYPALLGLVRRVPVRPRRIIAAAFCAFLLADSALSLLAVSRWSERRSAPATVDGPAPRGVDAFLDESFPDATLRAIYPTMRYIKEEKR